VDRVCTVGIVGGGWRSDFFARIAAALPERFALVGGAVRRPEAAEALAAQWGAPVYLSPGELVSAQHPDFVVTSLPWPVNPEVVAQLAGSGVRVLSETPLAPTSSQRRPSGLVQVAEQYLLYPGHAARRTLVERGVIGRPTSVQVSSTHMYHAVSLMRGLLGAGSGPVTVRASRFTAPLVDPLTREGWTGDDTAKDAGTTLATLDFGDGLSGLYDFTDNQWHNQLRLRRIVIRGSRGEIADDTVVRLTGPRTIVRSQLTRAQSGYDLNLDGFDTEQIVFDGEAVYRNPFPGHRWMDEEIALAALLTATAAWAHDEGPAPYPLAEASQDHLIALAVDESLRTGQPVVTERGPWAG
jgi:predicted dehydrogenase